MTVVLASSLVIIYSREYGDHLLTSQDLGVKFVFIHRHLSFDILPFFTPQSSCISAFWALH